MNTKLYFQPYLFFPNYRLQCVADNFAGLVTDSVPKHHTELIHDRGPILSPQTAPSLTRNTSCNRNAYGRLSFDRDFLLLLAFTIDFSVSLIFHMGPPRNVQVYQTPISLIITASFSAARTCRTLHNSLI